MATPAKGADIRKRLQHARIARLATVDAAGRPVVVPVCFAYDGNSIYTAIDRKRKNAPAQELARVRNITNNPEVALVVDHYGEDWQRLWYVLVRGRAVLLQDPRDEERIRAIDMLRRKYAQYRGSLLPEDASVIRIAPWHVKLWDSK
jgi:PPOX class probable F420-dependent enzyme